jgi:hypothetical protein
MRSVKRYGIIFIVVTFLLSVFAPVAAIASEGLPPVIPPPPATPPSGGTGG